MEEETQSVKKKGMNPLIIAVIVLVLLAGGWFVYSSSKKPTTASPTPSAAMKQNDNMSGDDMKESPSEAAMESKTGTPEAEEAGVTSVTVEGKNFSFNPSAITVKKGDKVKVTFKNSGGFHNWTLDYDGKQIATKTIKTGETDTVEFTADKAGTFAYYCSVGNHRQMGMEGKLIVK